MLFQIIAHDNEEGRTWYLFAWWQLSLCGVLTQSHANTIMCSIHQCNTTPCLQGHPSGERGSHCCSPQTGHKYSHNFNFRESVPHLLILLFFVLLILFDEGVRQWRGCVGCINTILAAARVSKEQVRIMAFPISNKRKKSQIPAQIYDRIMSDPWLVFIKYHRTILVCSGMLKPSMRSTWNIFHTILHRIVSAKCVIPSL